MNKHLLSMVVVMAAFSGAAYTADTSTSISTRESPPPLGWTPRVGVVRAVATSAAASAGAFTYDLTIPNGKNPYCVTTVRDVSGSLKLAGVNINTSGQVTVSNSIATSGTIAVSDTATTLCIFGD